MALGLPERKRERERASEGVMTYYKPPLRRDKPDFNETDRVTTVANAPNAYTSPRSPPQAAACAGPSENMSRTRATVSSTISSIDAGRL